jgi:hypothetical protein
MVIASVKDKEITITPWAIPTGGITPPQTKGWSGINVADLPPQLRGYLQ